MKVLGFVGSPRKGGNTDILVDEVLRGSSYVGGEVEKVFLSDLEISPCQAECSSNCKSTGECIIDDDMSPFYSKLYASDVIILGTPVYWYGPSAQLKTFIDRWYAFCHPEYKHKMKGKKFVLITPFEENDASVAKPLVDMITESVNYLEAEFYRKLLVSIGEKGAVKQNLEAMKKAYNIGLGLK